MYKALIVDDEVDIRDIIQSILKDVGTFSFVTAGDGLEACQKARMQKFDVIITDYKMPKVDGARLVNALRETTLNKDTGIIVLSGYVKEAQEELDRLCIKDIRFLEKPVFEEPFIKEINVILDLIKSKSPGGLSKPTTSAESKIDSTFIQPFIDSFTYTVQTYGQKKVNFSQMKVLSPAEVIPIDISGIISINSPAINGFMALSCDRNTFLRISSLMIGEPQSEITFENQDAICELANITFGHSKRILNTKNYHIQSAIPSIIKGKNHSLSMDVPILLIEAALDVGIMYLQFGLKKK